MSRTSVYDEWSFSPSDRLTSEKDTHVSFVREWAVTKLVLDAVVTSVKFQIGIRDRLVQVWTISLVLCDKSLDPRITYK
jgi:hypothetical protein